MKYIYMIEDGWVGGRPGPTRFPWDLMGLKMRGFHAIVSLDRGGLNRGAIRAAGIDHKVLHVEDFTAPTLEQILEFNDFVDGKVRRGSRVLVHCYAGRGRTGTMLASRLIRRGESTDDAVAKIRRQIFLTQGSVTGAIEPIQRDALLHFELRYRLESPQAPKKAV